MVDVGMGQQDEINLPDIEAEIEGTQVLLIGLRHRPGTCRNRPEKRRSPASTSVQEPVTSPAPPRNRIRMFSFLTTWRSMNLKRAKCKPENHFGRDHVQDILVLTDGSGIVPPRAAYRLLAGSPAPGSMIFYAKPEYLIAYGREGALIDPTTPEKFAELADQQAAEYVGEAEQWCRRPVSPAPRPPSTSDVPYEAIIDAAESPLRPDFSWPPMAAAASAACCLAVRPTKSRRTRKGSPVPPIADRFAASPHSSQPPSGRHAAPVLTAADGITSARCR